MFHKITSFILKIYPFAITDQSIFRPKTTAYLNKTHQRAAEKTPLTRVRTLRKPDRRGSQKNIYSDTLNKKLKSRDLRIFDYIFSRSCF